MTRDQCRAARAILDISRENLAELSKVSLRTIVDFERGARDPREITIDALRGALEAAGVIFVAENGEGPGVRLRKQKAARDPEAIKAQHGAVRAKAEAAVDKALTKVDAPAEEKDRRKQKLTRIGSLKPRKD